MKVFSRDNHLNYNVSWVNSVKCEVFLGMLSSCSFNTGVGWGGGGGALATIWWRPQCLSADLHPFESRPLSIFVSRLPLGCLYGRLSLCEWDM